MGMVMPTVGWAALHELALEEVLHKHAHRPDDGGNPSTEVPSSHVTS